MRKFTFVQIVLILIIVIHLVLLSRMNFLPYPELFVYPYLVTKGLLPYKEIIDQHFPGLMFFPINLYNLGMVNPQVARVWHLGVVSISHIFIYIASKKIFNFKKWWLLLPNLLYLVWQPFFEGYVLWIDTFIPLFFLSSYYFLAKYKAGKEKLLFFAGLLIGVAFVFKQVTGPLAGIILIYLLFKYKNLKVVTHYLLGFLIPIAFMLVYIISISVWSDFYFWTVEFNLVTFARMGRKLPSIGDMIKISLVYLLAAFYITFKYIRQRLSQHEVLLLIFFGLSLLFAYARFDFIHLQPALVFAVIIIAIIVRSLDKKLLAVFASIYVVGSILLLRPFYRISFNNEVFFFGEFEERLTRSVLEYAKPGDRIFAFATTPHLYVLTQTLPPGDVFVFHFPWFMMEAEGKILNGIKKDEPKVVVRDEKATVQGMNLVSFMPNINRFIEENYKVIGQIDSTEIMIPK